MAPSPLIRQKCASRVLSLAPYALGLFMPLAVRKHFIVGAYPRPSSAVILTSINYLDTLCLHVLTFELQTLVSANVYRS